MPFGFADNVGVGSQSNDRSTNWLIGGPLSPRRAVETVKDLLSSPQFQDGVRLFAIGAAVSASKMIFDTVISTLKRIFIGQATFRGRDEAFRWMMLLMMNQPAFRQSPRAVEVTAKPTLLVDYEANMHGELNEDEIKEAWASIQGKDSDDIEKNEIQERKDEYPSMYGLGVHFYPATEETISFTFEGVRFWASRQRELVGDESWDETIKLYYLSLSSNPLRSIIKHARDLFKQSTRGRVSILRVDRYGHWHESGGMAKRSVDSVHLPFNIKERLLEDAKNFLSPETRRWYEERGIPYRRGYLLHGVPGSGKSSLCHVLASETNRPIYVLNLSAASMDDETFNERMSEIPGGALVLIEDVDAAFVDREASIESQSKGKKGGGISFSTLLNALDGIGAVEGRLLCLTTNHIEKLDPALIRPGRIDLRFEFKNANQEQAKELFLRWYLPRHSERIEEISEKDQESKVVQNLAEQFAGKVKPNSLSVAAIQGFLLSCGKDYRKAVKDIDRWFEEHETIRDV
ncbi:hypothetical protein L7F22_009370 [Adiantum nelumboides]|nr:hypothetical protein [Adiantum nelumboides]